MDEAGGCCGLLVILVVIILAIVVWRGMRQEVAPVPPSPVEVGAVEQGGPPGEGKAPPAQRRLHAPIGWWPIGPRAALLVVGLLYGIGLLMIRPAAQRAKRHGASNQQAALTALTLFAMSPVVVPVKGIWYGLGALGEALTRTSDDRAKPSKPRGFDDLD